MAVLDVLEREGVQQNVIAAGRVLESGLARLAAKHPLVADVRGKGLFWGLEIVRDHATRAPAVEEADRIMISSVPGSGLPSTVQSFQARMFISDSA